MVQLRTRLGNGARSTTDRYGTLDGGTDARNQINRQKAKIQGEEIQKKYPIGTMLRTALGTGKVVGYTHAGLRFRKANGKIESVSEAAIIKVLK